MQHSFDSIKVHEEHLAHKLRNVSAMTFETHPFHDYFRELPFLKAKRHFDLDDQHVLVASCGTGLDIHYLMKHYRGIRFHASDISAQAVRVAMNTFHIDGSVQDNEKLSFDDNAFDYSFVAASLHHLMRPHKGLYELLRVARKGVLVIEPQDCWLTRLAVRLKCAAEYERALGNYVFRYSQHEVVKIARALFCDCKVVRLFAIHRIARSRVEFLALKVLNGMCNACFPAFGNYIMFSITKRAA